MAVAEGNVGLAFGLTAIAGLATALGASIVFFTKVANRVVLAISLGAAGGVMLFISFYSLLSQTSIDSFKSAGLRDGMARLYALISFFSGIMLMRLLDWGLHLLSEVAAKRNVEVPTLTPSHGQGVGLPDWMLPQDQVRPDNADIEGGTIDGGEIGGGKKGGSETWEKQEVQSASTSPGAAAAAAANAENNPEQFAHLMRTGTLTAVVLGLHNFPEGVATFVSALRDVKLGITMCLAIALHNIPEGICVAMPVYYATQSKWKGFFWALLSGLAEPIGAVLAYAVLAHHVSDIAFGILFGGIAGVMVGIVLAELLPAARKYDPEDKVVTTSMVCGMVVMATSLVLFDI